MTPALLAAIRAHAPLRILVKENGSPSIVSPSNALLMGMINLEAESDVLRAYLDEQFTGPRARLQTWAEFLATVESQQSP